MVEPKWGGRTFELQDSLFQNSQLYDTRKLKIFKSSFENHLKLNDHVCHFYLRMTILTIFF